MQNTEKGKKYEELAAGFLKKNGVHILERNFRCRQGEIDLIGRHRDCLVFVEVKYRKNNCAGTPEEAVGIYKQQKICRTSDYYRVLHSIESSRQIRYDVIAISGEKLTWYQNAFFYQRGGF